MERSILFWGDNLEVMRERLDGGAADLVYLDPPFNSNRSYGLFSERRAKSKGGSVYTDTWRWDERAEAYLSEMESRGGKAYEALRAVERLLGRTDVLAYLCMMAPRLAELERVTRPGGSVYLHCDPRTSHYLKVLMDAVFGPRCFVNEIVWHYRRWTNAHKALQRMHDVILFYRREGPFSFSPPQVEPAPTQAEAIKRGWNVNKVKNGDSRLLQLLIYDREKAQAAVERGLLDPAKYGRVVYRDRPRSAASDTWTDIPCLHSQAKERTGYPTQKPQALLDRIIRASSREGDTVLDPFCGSGTTLAAAEAAGRRWIGIEKSPEAVEITRQRLDDEGAGPYSFIRAGP